MERPRFSAISCSLARRFAEPLAAIDGLAVGNQVVLNQVLVSFSDDHRTDRVIAQVQRSGECWMGATTWHGKRLMRISVSSWRTTADDVDRSVAAIRAATERDVLHDHPVASGSSWAD
ncbi:MAG TPA: hypothetical protein VNB24_00660 [Acidimicrobiales bacterium]|nr:hypothetical protein [Acidimicrobiales bacterium]